MNKPQVGEIYQHFKGNIIKIIAIGIHTETKEEMVVYEHDNDIWIRTMEMFLSKVDNEKYANVKQENQFKKIS